MKKNNLFQKVYSLVRLVPEGKVTTYGDVAKKIKEDGVMTSPQMVGFALHANSGSDNAPCHRVVNKDGRVAPGFAFGGQTIQRQLLEAEGISFIDETHIDLSRYRFSF